MGNQNLFTSLTIIALISTWWWIPPATAACSPIGGGNACKECISRQMKHGCPSCGPILQCMGRCLWAGTSKTKCIKKCDCGGGMLTLSDCKKCMAPCKCSCVAYNI